MPDTNMVRRAPQRGARRAEAIDIRLAERLRKLREELNVSRREACEALGVTAQQLQKYELGQDRLSIGRLVKLARAYGVSPEWLIRGLDDGAEGHDPALEAQGVLLLACLRRLGGAEARAALLEIARQFAAFQPGKAA